MKNLSNLTERQELLLNSIREQAYYKITSPNSQTMERTIKNIKAALDQLQIIDDLQKVQSLVQENKKSEDTEPYEQPDKNMKVVDTFEAKIYVGREISMGRNFGRIITVPLKDIENSLQEYCNLMGFCVSLTETKFIYTDGIEPGVIVGLINYPRFPKEVQEIKRKAFEIARFLKKLCHQQRCSIVMSDLTYMIE
jgi:hypothetical protein